MCSSDLTSTTKGRSLRESFYWAISRSADATFTGEYFTKRGPGTGLDAKYVGGIISETTLEPWSYSGDLKSYAVWDHGEDDMGKEREDVDPRIVFPKRILRRGKF